MLPLLIFASIVRSIQIILKHSKFIYQVLTKLNITLIYFVYVYIHSGAHGHGCQDAPQSSSSPNIITKANKREAPDDDQVTSAF